MFPEKIALAFIFQLTVDQVSWSTNLLPGYPPAFFSWFCHDLLKWWFLRLSWNFENFEKVLIFIWFWVFNQELTFKSLDEFIFVSACRILVFLVLSYILVVAFQVLKRNLNFCIYFSIFLEHRKYCFRFCTIWKTWNLRRVFKIRNLLENSGNFWNFSQDWSIHNVVQYQYYCKLFFRTYTKLMLWKTLLSSMLMYTLSSSFL